MALTHCPFSVTPKIADLLGSILSSMEKPPSLGDQETQRKARVGFSHVLKDMPEIISVYTDIQKLHQQFEMYKEQVKKMGEESQQQQEQKGDAPTCGICHKTKFADGCGHNCSYCQTKFCARCGGRVSLRSNKTKRKAEACQFKEKNHFDYGIVLESMEDTKVAACPCRDTPPMVMWVCNLCRKQQEILTKSGAWFYNSGSNTPQQPDQKVLRGLRNEEAPQEKKAKLHEQAQFQGPSGDLSVPAVEKSRSHGLTRQDSIKNGSGVKHQIASDVASDSSPTSPEAGGPRALEGLGRRPRSTAHGNFCPEDRCEADCWQSGTSNRCSKGLVLTAMRWPGSLNNGTALTSRIGRILMTFSPRNIILENEEATLMDSSSIYDSEFPVGQINIIEGKEVHQCPEIRIEDTTKGKKEKNIHSMLLRTADSNRRSHRHSKEYIVDDEDAEGRDEYERQRREEEYQARYRSDPNLARYPVKPQPYEEQMRIHAEVSRARHERRHSDVSLANSELEDSRISMLRMERPSRQRSVSERRAAMERFRLHPVTWQPSKDGDRLIGRILLNKRLKDGSVPRDSGAMLGLKVVGGKMTESGRLCAFITKVKKGSLADTVGHLRPGDEVLEWNGRLLQGATFEEVYNIILESKPEPQVELVVSRPIGSFESQKMDRPSISVTSPMSPGMLRDVPQFLSGQLSIKLWFDKVGHQLIVTILGAKDLPSREDGRPRNPYVKIYFLPDRSDKNKRRTKTVKKTLEPKWNQTFIYSPVHRREFRERMLEITLWDQARVREEESEFLGEILIELETALLDDEPHWYKLQTHDVSSLPLPHPSPYMPRRQLHGESPTRRLQRSKRISDSEVSDYDCDDGIGVVSDNGVKEIEPYEEVNEVTGHVEEQGKEKQGEEVKAGTLESVHINDR
ncbi:hypothetical protein E2I00_012509 [Balaenoptera physalus]|uniref:Regulating synaptic membrane exocytosis protein 2 n=1 Tax=Balaenoptera physalus TaxID=9770 RepID=A0A643BNA4_BALPH|nr:hypothetical protein E2I00_012509 [Balaenoptera physalus]